MVALGYLAKLKKGLGLAFGAHFLHGFSVKCSLLNSLLMHKVSVSHRIAFSRYQTKCVIKVLLRKLMTSLFLDFFLDQPLKQWLTAEKSGENENTKI